MTATPLNNLFSYAVLAAWRRGNPPRRQIISLVLEDQPMVDQRETRCCGKQTNMLAQGLGAAPHLGLGTSGVVACWAYINVF